MYLAGNFQSPQANSWRSLRYTVLLFSDSQFSEEYCFKWLKVCEIDNFFSLPVCTADQAGKYPRLLACVYLFFLLHEPTSFYMPFAICSRIGLQHHFSFWLHAFKCLCEQKLELCQKLRLWIKDDDICPVVGLHLHFWFFFFNQQGSAVLR